MRCFSRALIPSPERATEQADLSKDRARAGVDLAPNEFAESE
jgi:hypothetical protein